MANRKLTKWRVLGQLQWFTFILPTIVCLVVLTYRPLITSIKYSFYSVRVIGFGERFVGLRNYRGLISSLNFSIAIGNTFVLMLLAFLVIPLGFILAVLINEIGRNKLQSFFRVAYYLPNILTGISIVMIFQFILRQDGGLLNSIISIIAGREVTIGWLVDSKLTKFAVTIMYTWTNLGYNMLINLAGLQSIPGEIYESASIDGCNGFKSVIYITIPNMVNTFAFLLITSVIGSFARFNDVFMIGGNSVSGKPAFSLQTIMMYIYQFTFDDPNYGLSSAGAMILFIMTMIVTLFNLRMTGLLKKQHG
jgi:ABC-type sugar transport system permease subunit